MVREIVHVQVGQCGNQIGNAFWDMMGAEHRLDPSGQFKGKPEEGDNQERLDKIDVYYQEARRLLISDAHRFVPRACLIDLEPGTTDAIKASPMGSLFKPDNMCFGASGVGNNWAKGHYSEGAELIDDVVDIIRRETECCDCPQGFQLTHSLGGGTGSGLGTLLLRKLRDNYRDRIAATFSVYHSPKVSDVVLEPYNTTLSIHHLLEYSHETFVIDNEALFSISHNVLKQENPKYADLNWLISLTMSGITASLRFSVKLNGDLRRMGVNLVPFPRLHFFLLAQAPLFAPGQGHKERPTVQELTDQVWHWEGSLSKVCTLDGKYLTVCQTYRGNVATPEVDDEASKLHAKLQDDFVSWIPNNIKTSIISVAPEGTRMSETLIANTTAIKGVFQRISAQFAKLYKRKQFLHWYEAEGMDEMQFQEADRNVRDLITEFQDKQDAVVDLDDWDDEEDEEEEEDDD